MDSAKIPPVSPELVTWLSGVYPDKSPEPTDTDREIWMAVGRAQVVRKLRHESVKQHTTVLAEPS